MKYIFPNSDVYYAKITPQYRIENLDEVEIIFLLGFGF